MLKVPASSTVEYHALLPLDHRLAFRERPHEVAQTGAAVETQKEVAVPAHPKLAWFARKAWVGLPKEAAPYRVEASHPAFLESGHKPHRHQEVRSSPQATWKPSKLLQVSSSMLALSPQASFRHLPDCLPSAAPRQVGLDLRSAASTPHWICPLTHQPQPHCGYRCDVDHHLCRGLYGSDSGNGSLSATAYFASVAGCANGVSSGSATHVAVNGFQSGVGETESAGFATAGFATAGFLTGLGDFWIDGCCSPACAGAHPQRVHRRCRCLPLKTQLLLPW